MKHVFIGLPIYRAMEAGTVLSLLELINHPPEPFHFTPIIVSFPDVSGALNTISKVVKDSKSPLAEAVKDYEKSALLFVDSDMQFKRQDFLSLYEYYDLGKWGVIAAHATKRSYPFASCYKPVVDGDHKDVVKCEHVGMAFTLIRPEIFDKLEMPFSPKPAQSFADSESEDISFCRKARDLGYKVGCALSVPIGHIGLYAYGPWDQEGAKRFGPQGRTERA